MNHWWREKLNSFSSGCAQTCSSEMNFDLFPKYQVGILWALRLKPGRTGLLRVQWDLPCLQVKLVWTAGLWWRLSQPLEQLRRSPMALTMHSFSWPRSNLGRFPSLIGIKWTGWQIRVRQPENLPRMETNQTLPSVMKIHSLNVLCPLPRPWPCSHQAVPMVGAFEVQPVASHFHLFSAYCKPRQPQRHEPLSFLPRERKAEI